MWRWGEMCNCASYNLDATNKSQVILDPNDFFDLDYKAKTVCVDACISEQIKALWSAGIWTIGSCCGHNGRFGNPSVVLGDNEKPIKAIEILKENDSARDWDVFQWQLVNCTDEVNNV
jgi:hypothetical protein